MKQTLHSTRGSALWAAIAIVGVLGVLAVAIALTCLSTVNAEVRQRNLFTAKLASNEAVFDGMKKKLPMAAEAADRMMDQLKDLYIGYANARTVKNEQAIVTFLTESVPPNVQGTDAYKEFMRIAVAARDDFANVQKELADIKRVHDDMIGQQPSKLILGMFGNIEPLPLKIISSSATKETFRTGIEEPEESAFGRKK